MMLARGIVALLAGLIAALFGVTASAAAFTSESTVAAYTYGGHQVTEQLNGTSAERGPLLTYDRGATGASADLRSHGASARPQVCTALATYDYDDLARHAQSARGSHDAGERVGGPTVGLVVVERSDAAANGVRTAAPGAFTRTEALAGRASSRNVRELAESMRTNGWQGSPIDVVELNGQRIIVDGHHRVAAARLAGIDVPYQVVDPATVIGRGQWSSIDDILQDTYNIARDRLR